ncbi:MAG: ECF transporter S component [Clostridia bacterium]|nr:ECF transporter S component [Clostridia bacterium]
MASPKTRQPGSTSMVRKLTTTAVMAAIATILMYIEFPIPIMPGFIKLDFSELPALLTAVALGPGYGALVCLLKNLIHLPVTSSSGVGELANFLIGICFVIPAGAFYQLHKSREGALAGSLFGAFIMAAVSYPINYFIVYTFYTNYMPMEAIIGAYQAILPSIRGLSDALLIFNVPFTFVKGMIDVVITFLVYKRLSPIIKGTNSKKQAPDT